MPEHRRSLANAMADIMEQLRSLEEHHAATAACARCLGHRIDDTARQEAYAHATAIVKTAWDKALPRNRDHG